MVRISVSVLDVDFTNLERAVGRIEEAKIDSLHMDIMDGHFVENISFGPEIVRAIRKLTDLPLHTHLMISNPEKFTDSFFNAGSQSVTIHFETLTDNNVSLFNKSKMGISFNPGVPVENIYPYLDKVDRVLVMSVHAGFGGQQFIEESLGSIYKLAERRGQGGLDYIISVDGGVNADNAARCLEAGVDELCVGSYVTKSDDPRSKVEQLRQY